MLKGKETPAPSPTYMSGDQMALYLKTLRQDRPARPSGSRPAPPTKYGSLRKTDAAGDVVVRPHNEDDRPALSTSNSMPIMPHQKLSHRRTESNLASQGRSRSPFVGRPLATALSASNLTFALESDPQSTHVRRTPSMAYMENGTRWMEKQEAKSLRQALQDMDLERELKIHEAAQDEAAELVFKHQNAELADGPFRNPDLKDYKSHLRKGSYRASFGQSSIQQYNESQRSASDSSQDSTKGRDSNNTTTAKCDHHRKVSPPSGSMSVQKRRESAGKSYDQLAKAVAKDIAVAHRRTSSGSKRIMSGDKKRFMSPDDRIWEDPDEERPSLKEKEKEREEPVERSIVPPMPAPVPAPTLTQALPSHVRKNPFARVRAQYDKMERSNSAPTLQSLPSSSQPRHDRVEIQRNPPSQSRNPLYMSNESIVLPPTPPGEPEHEADEVAPKSTPTKDGFEVRSDDIRAATSKSRRAYSPNLPQPTMVSDKPGRPIVSFQKDWAPKEIVMAEQRTPPRNDTPPSSPSKSGIPKINIDDVPKWTPSTQGTTPARPPSSELIAPPKPPVPMICTPDDPEVPSISLSEEPSIAAPSIVVDEPSADSLSKIDQSRRPLPKPSTVPSPGRPLPHHANTAPVPTRAGKSTPHMTPSFRPSGALCAQCALPIAGRILSAAGERFHPGCFVCHECNTDLECVAFYPEPEKQRTARVERIQARQDGVPVPIPEDATPESLARMEYTDGDSSLRFYCHLDFHELFSPRCKSCKTPIEGEVIVACGAEWHVGHFFCAQCGDPFDSKMPFVEKDGYAWCVGCHTNRYSSKCRKCKKPVTDVVVKALGSDWHAECFVCVECRGDFADGRYFLRGESQDPVCVKCEERRLKA